MSLYGIPKYYSFQAQEADEDDEKEEQGAEEDSQEQEAAGEETPTTTPTTTPGEGEEGYEEPAAEPPVSETPTTPTTPTVPTPPTTPTPTINTQAIVNQFTALIQSGLGFFQQLDAGKFFILLGIFFLFIGMFSGKKQTGGLPTILIFLIGFVLVMYGGMQKFGGGAGFNLSTLLPQTSQS